MAWLPGLVGAAPAALGDALLLSARFSEFDFRCTYRDLRRRERPLSAFRPGERRALFAAMRVGAAVLGVTLIAIALRDV